MHPWHMCNIHTVLSVSVHKLVRNFFTFANFTAWSKVVRGGKESRPSAETHGLHSNAEFQPWEPPIWMDRGHDSSSPIAVDMLMGKLQCCDHLGPAPWGLNSAVVHSAGSYARAYRTESNGSNSYLSIPYLRPDLGSFPPVATFLQAVKLANLHKYILYMQRNTQKHSMQPQHGLDEASTDNSQGGWYRVDWLSCYNEFTAEWSDYLPTSQLPCVQIEFIFVEHGSSSGYYFWRFGALHKDNLDRQV